MKLPIKMALLQRLNLPKSRSFDERAERFRERGAVGLGCEEFVSMSEVPPFHEKILPRSTEVFRAPQLNELTQTLKSLLKKRNFEELVEVSEKALDHLATTPHYNCLLRHFLESIIRAADLVPRRLARVEALELKPLVKQELKTDTVEWSEDFIDLQIGVLKLANVLDERVSGLQAAGLPLFCQDLPYIPKAPISAAHL